jgi:hypothetical protein
MALLREHNLEVFAPDVSMVINADTACDVRDFVKYALATGLSHVGFFFDYTENDMSSDCFGRPETSRPALRELMKIERVLARKFFVSFRLWIPLRESERMQSEVEAIPLAALREEYADLLALADNRSMQAEYDARQRIRREQGKKPFTFDEDWSATVRQTKVCGKDVCFCGRASAGEKCCHSPSEN